MIDWGKDINMLSRLKEDDFKVLRGSFESGRQRPGALGSMLILSIFLQALMFFLAYVAAGDDSIFPNKEAMFKFHLVTTIIFILLSIIYAIPKVYLNSQKVQYLITIFVSQNLFGILPYTMALFYIGKSYSVTRESLLAFTFITLSFGVLIFIITCIRFYILLKKGQYREGSKKDEIRSRTEAGIKSYLPMIITGSIGLLFIIQFLVRTFGLMDIQTIFMLSLCILVLYAMLFVLPEQLVTLYCKYRFDSFNYDKYGNLKPMGTDRKDVIK